MIYLMQMNYRVSCIDQPIAACAGIYGLDYKNNITTYSWKNDRNFKKVFKLFLIHDNRMLAERAFYCLI